MRIPFRERNPVPIALIGFAVIILALVLAMNLGNLPFVNGGTTHTATFAEAAGLKSGEEVRIAGVDPSGHVRCGEACVARLRREIKDLLACRHDPRDDHIGE